MPSFSIKPDDQARLQHMLDAALEIEQYIRSSTRDDLNHDRKLVHSLVHLLEIIGEAVAQVSGETRLSAPEIPWPIVVGMRNRLIHAYFSINLDIVWKTSTEDIPRLVAGLNTLLGRGQMP
jgi:uncharacterized protein with HEPN domain